MSSTRAQRLPTSQCRRAIRLSYANAALWAVGNGLASTTLVVYLALDLGAAGLGLSLILAAPALVGVLRQLTPRLIGPLARRKRFCLAGYLLSVLMLTALPLLAQPGRLPSRSASLTALVVIWCAYHLAEYMASVALWSWLGDLVPRPIRGRFVGRRERWLNAGRIPGMLASGLFAMVWRDTHPRADWWLGYAIPAAVGMVMLLTAIIPLHYMPSVGSAVVGEGPLRRTSLLAPFADRRFRRLLLFGCWISFFNGVTQSAQNIYPIRVLGMSLIVMLMLRIVLRWGQLTISPTIGRLADRYGNRPIMIASQLLVATGPLFFLMATPDRGWLVAGAWIVWIAYAGMNVCLPNLMLKLAPEVDNSSHVATYFAVTGLFYGVSTIIWGIAFDYLSNLGLPFVVGPFVLDHYQYLFFFGWVARSLSVVFLLMLIEPRAWSWRQIVRTERPVASAV